MISASRSMALGFLLAAAGAFAIPVMIAATGGVALAQTTDPGKFVQDLGAKAIAQLAGKEIPLDEERSRFRKLLIAYFDLNAIGKFTVGRGYWTTATPAQQTEFLSLYESQVTNAYAKRFQNYSGEQFSVTGQQRESDTDTVVTSQIARPSGGAPVSVQWRVRSESGGMKIVDVVIDGISMAVTDRQQFAAVIERGGGTIQALIDALKTRNLTPAPAR